MILKKQRSKRAECLLQHLKRHDCFLFLLILASFLFVPQDVFAGNDVLHVSWERTEDLIAPYMSVLEDPDGSLAWRDVQNAEYESRFIPVHTAGLNFGMSESVFWLRFRMVTALGERGTVSINRVFTPGAGFPGRLRWSLYDGPTGSLIADNQFASHGNDMVEMRITPGGRHYYLKIRSDTALILRPRLQTWYACLAQNRIAAIGFGLFFGIIGAVAVYNLLLFFSFSDRSYLWYVIHLVCVLFYFLGINGLTGQYFIKGNPDFVGMLNRTFLGGMAASMTLLTRSFLMTRILAPGIDRAFVVFFWMTCLLIGLNVLVSARFVNVLLSLLGIVIPLMMALASWQSMTSGFKPARLYMAAWCVFIVGALSFALTASGTVPFTLPGFYAFQAGCAVAAVLLSFALGNRIQSLQSEQAKLRKKEKDLRRLATIDPLTGAANRRAFMAEGTAALDRARVSGLPLSLLMMDVDHFKTVNDTYGHSAGDLVLKSLVRVCAGILRETDIFGRLGGEEFGVILPDTDAGAAAAIGERLRQALAGTSVTSGKDTISVTMSIGLAVFSPSSDDRKPDTLERIIIRSDAALYRAKQLGRNCLVADGTTDDQETASVAKQALPPGKTPSVKG